MWPYDPEQNAVTGDGAYAVDTSPTRWRASGWADRWVFRIADRRDACWGLTSKQLDELYATCDAMLNIVGATDLREEHMAAPLRVYVETDPVTLELRLANGDEHTRVAFAAHDAIITYGENYGTPDCGVPLNGISLQ